MRKGETQLATMNDILDTTSLGIPAQLCKVKHVIHSFDQWSAAGLNSLKERCLTVIQLCFGEQFGRSENLWKGRDLVCITGTEKRARGGQIEKGPRTYPVQRRSEFMGNTNETRSTVRMVVIEEPAEHDQIQEWKDRRPTLRWIGPSLCLPESCDASIQPKEWWHLKTWQKNP